jgi:hypothetical protein
MVTDLAIGGTIKSWSAVADRIGGRTSKQCRERWFNHLDPNIKRGDYSSEEDHIILAQQGKIGNRWSLISAMLPGRTEDAVKIRCKILQRIRNGFGPLTGQGKKQQPRKVPPPQTQQQMPQAQYMMPPQHMPQAQHHIMPQMLPMPMAMPVAATQQCQPIIQMNTDHFTKHFTLHYDGNQEPNQENQEPIAPLHWNNGKSIAKPRADSLQESLEWLEDALLSPTQVQNDPLIKLEQASCIDYGKPSPSATVRVVDFDQKFDAQLVNFGADFHERLSM